MRLRPPRRPALLAAALTTAALGAAATGATAGAPAPARDYVVVYAEGASAAEGRAAIRAAGGRVVRENARVGIATARAGAGFARRAVAQEALVGAAGNRPVGRSPVTGPAARDAVERAGQRRGRPARSRARAASPSVGDPLYPRQWDMTMIGASLEGSYRRQQGARAVRVGIIDSGIDGRHPDIRPNFNGELSRNFTRDIPLVDGPCEEEPDASCSDPADVDENGHGTHVAGTVGAPLNGRGISGVAPRVELVNLRAGQDSGYFFLQGTVDALTYAGDNGVDVVNMSFYVDPWLYNCASNPADSPEAQAEQRTIIEGVQRALAYARARQVTLVGSLGNSHTDLGRPETDETSPDFPPDAAYEREVDNSCLDLPVEGQGVIGVSAVGPSKRKAFYSNYGTEQTDLSAPGGDTRDPTLPRPENAILSSYPEAVLRAERDAQGRPVLDPEGAPLTPSIVRECRGEGARQRCAYYRYLQGTSMASPHVAGVAALVVSQYGERDPRGGRTLDPDRVESVLREGATDTACPMPRLFEYPDPDLGPEFNAYCEGDADSNGFYGDGIVSATGVLPRPE